MVGRPPRNACKQSNRLVSKASDALLSSLLNPLEGPSVLNCGIMELGGAPDFQHYRGVEGCARSPEIRLGRGTRLTSLNLHPKPTTRGLVRIWEVRIREHPRVLGQATSTLTHKTHHDPDSGEAITFPHIVFSAPLRGGYIQMALFPGTPNLESRNCPETIPVGVPRLWELISPDCQVWSRRGLNQSYSSLWELSNAMLHSWFGFREEVDSRLLVVGNQTASLTPGPSFAHNLGYKCPSDQCEAILDIYTSRPFQRHQENPNARPFWTSTLQDLSNDIKKTPMQGVLVSAVEL